MMDAPSTCEIHDPRAVLELCKISPRWPGAGPSLGGVPRLQEHAARAGAIGQRRSHRTRAVKGLAGQGAWAPVGNLRRQARFLRHVFPLNFTCGANVRLPSNITAPT